MAIPDVVQRALDEVAQRRDRKYADHPQDAPRVDNYMEAAMAGEWAFAEFAGLMPDLKEREFGDKGIDFDLPLLLTVDVKTVQGGKHLLHKVGKSFADIYVMADYDRATKEVRLIGWAWGSTLRQTAPADFKRGYLCHHLAREQLRPMHELRSKQAFLRRQP